MARSSRTFRLTVSPAGMDLLIDAHCHLIRATRALIAWGTTLHVAVQYLDLAAVEDVGSALETLPTLGLMGDQIYFLGAPIRLNDVATGIVGKVSRINPGRPAPELRQVYLVALQHLMSGDGASIDAIYRQFVE